MSEEELAPHPQPRRYSIGYAFQPRKIQNFLQSSLLDYANQRGIDLIQIDPTKPLTQQGHFHCIIHKLHPQDWNKLHLNDYLTEHPNSVIIDPPELVEQLHNRVSMLDAMTHLRISIENDTVSVPAQVLVNSDKENGTGEMGSTPRFPVIAKPLFADGTASSHKLCMVFDREGLASLDNNTPMVLQEFVNHGGVVFKVYVAGEHVTCVKRRSLPDISEEKAKTMKGLVGFSQISNLTVQESSSNNSESNTEKAEMPPQSLITELGRALREAMGLKLFNVDVIRDAIDCNRYLVIDINYFPGYAKLPCYESFITDFLLDSVRNKTA